MKNSRVVFVVFVGVLFTVLACAAPAVASTVLSEYTNGSSVVNWDRPCADMVNLRLNFDGGTCPCLPTEMENPNVDNVWIRVRLFDVAKRLDPEFTFDRGEFIDLTDTVGYYLYADNPMNSCGGKQKLVLRLLDDERITIYFSGVDFSADIGTPSNSQVQVIIRFRDGTSNICECDAIAEFQTIDYSQGRKYRYVAP